MVPLVWVAPRGSPPCRMGPVCSRDAGKCLCAYLVIPRAGSSLLLLCVGHLGFRGCSGWLVGMRLMCASLSPHPVPPRRACHCP